MPAVEGTGLHRGPVDHHVLQGRGAHHGAAAGRLRMNLNLPAAAAAAFVPLSLRISILPGAWAACQAAGFVPLNTHRQDVPLPVLISDAPLLA